MQFAASRARLGRILVRVLAAVGALYLVVTFTPLTLWWARALSNPWLDADGEVLIVPGADAPMGNLIGNASYWRALYAARAWQGGHFQAVVLAGGDDVAVSMRDFLVCEGVRPEVIQIETSSMSTRENALYTRDLLARLPGRKVLLT